MQQYHDHLKLILEKGTEKAPAREGMPSSRSYFGHQNRYNLQEGFPILTTKKVPFRWVVVELLWFLRGDTNIKYLDEKGVDKMWHEDSYNYYKKIALQNENDHLANILYMGIDKDGQRTNPVSTLECSSYSLFTFEEFCKIIAETPLQDLPRYNDYVLGSCGMQYGALWRRWNKDDCSHLLELKIANPLSEEQKKEFLDAWQNQGVSMTPSQDSLESHVQPLQPFKEVDQIKNLIEGLLKSPEGRRHIATAWNPETLSDMALNACHSSFQMNCRKLTFEQRIDWAKRNIDPDLFENLYITELADSDKCPQYYLDCHMYQRSADMFLGVPFNISSYALLTHIIAAICNMIPGELVHTFGDSHIYSNHTDQVAEILSRDPQKYDLPKLKTCFDHKEGNSLPDYVEKYITGRYSLEELLGSLQEGDFKLENYQSYPHIPAPLSTGLAK